MDKWMGSGEKLSFDYFYNVQSTPLIYILDKIKKS